MLESEPGCIFIKCHLLVLAEFSQVRSVAPVTLLSVSLVLDADPSAIDR